MVVPTTFGYHLISMRSTKNAYNKHEGGRRDEGRDGNVTGDS